MKKKLMKLFKKMILCVFSLVLLANFGDKTVFAETANIDKVSVEKVIHSYFDLKYQSFGKLKIQDGFEELFAKNDNTSEEMTIVDTTIKFRKMQLEDLAYDKYKLELDINILELGNEEAKVQVEESSTINFKGFPGVDSEMVGKFNEFELVKINGEWLIKSIMYEDVIRDELKSYSKQTSELNSGLNSGLLKQIGITSVLDNTYIDDTPQERLLLDAKIEVNNYKNEIQRAINNKSNYVTADTNMVSAASLSLKDYTTARRAKAVEYARANVLKGTISGFDNYESLGGDCTNFVSACLYNGGIPMDNSGDYKWYYYSSTNRVPAWTGAEYFRKYLIGNNPSSATSNKGLFAYKSMLSSLREGDVVQNNKDNAGHSMFISKATLITGAAYQNHAICQRSTGKSGRLKDYPLASKGYTNAGYYKIYGYY